MIDENPPPALESPQSPIVEIELDKDLVQTKTFLNWWFYHVNSGLGHKNSLLELRLKKKDAKIAESYFYRTEEEAIKKCQELKTGKWDGHVWFGLQPRKAMRGRNEDVEALIFYGIDFDARSKDPKNGTEEEDFIDIIRWGKYELKSLFDETESKPPYFVISSGNGIQAFLVHKPLLPLPEECREHTARTMQIGNNILSEIPHYNIVVDEVKDTARVLRLVGFANPKGGRVAETLEYTEIALLLPAQAKVSIEVTTKSPVLDIALKKKIGEVKRYNYFVHLVGLMASAKWSLEAARAALEKFNRENCSRPAEPYYIENALSSYDRWIKSNRTIVELEREQVNISQWIDTMIEFDTPQEAERFLSEKLKRIPKKMSGDSDFLLLKFYTYVLPMIILKEYPAKTSQPDDRIMVYDAGIWAEAEYKIRMFLELSNMTKDSRIVINERRKNEIVSQIKDSTAVSIKDFDNASPFLLPMQNGVLDIRTATLIPYTPNYMFTKKFGVEYNPSAKCERFEKFLDEICSNSEEPALMKKGLKQLMGYCLWRGYELQKMFFLIGGGSNGKGVYMKIIEKILSQENVSSVSASALAESAFAKAELFGKYANISSELTVEELKDVDNLKALTGGDLIEAEKKFKNPFTFTNKAKIIIASNQPPEIADNTVGFFRRVHIFKFMRQFLEKNADPTLLGTLTTSESLSAIFNIAVAELKEWIDTDGNLKADARFADELAITVIQEMYEKLSDPVMAFIYDCCYHFDETQPKKERVSDAFVSKEQQKAYDLADKGVVTKAAMYDYYRRFCNDRMLPPLSEISFGKVLRFKSKWIGEGNTKIDDRNCKCWTFVVVDEDKLEPNKKLMGG